jgi:hypothetical protein
MLRVSICGILWLTAGMATARALRADEPGPTLKELIRQARDLRTFDTPAEAVKYHLTLHASPQWGQRRHLLVISWFRGNGRTALRYTVTEDGTSEDVREVYSHASQVWQQTSLSAKDLKRLTDLLPNLPESKAEPPIERTVHVSFQSGDKWRTETYDASTLPDEFEAVLKITGERFETKDRHKGKK